MSILVEDKTARILSAWILLLFLLFFCCAHDCYRKNINENASGRQHGQTYVKDLAAFAAFCCD